MENKDVQEIAKMTIQYAKEIIKPGISLIDLRNDLEKKMLELGADSFWYWDVGAFIFSGDETNVSISGKHYVTANKTIQNNDIITIDLSPQNNNVWGDYARTIIIENGIVVDCVGNIENEEWKKGLQMEDRLHQELLKYVTVETTFEDLYFHMNHLIKEYGFINLDFLGNLGHSIVNRSEDRIYIEKGNKTKLIDVNYFTFEPHISVLNSKYGYKKENIYYFVEEKLVDMGFDPMMGARPLRRVIQEQIEDGIAEFYLDHPSIHELKAKLDKDGKIIVTSKPERLAKESTEETAE